MSILYKFKPAIVNVNSSTFITMAEVVLYYLMIKEIEETGLRYLCKRKYIPDSNDHILYKGSGVYWKRVLKAHPEYNIKTTVLGLYDKDEIREYGSYYSTLYNIVESKEWANLMPETGDGGDTSSTPGYIAAKQRGEFSNIGARYFYNPLTNETIMVKKGDAIPEGYVAGCPRITTNGTARYHNPETGEIVMFSANDTIPHGFVKGGIKGKFNYGPKDKLVYNNGVDRIYLNKDDEIPSGFVRGYASGTTTDRVGYYNPLTGKKRYIKCGDAIPDGFIKGIAPTTGKRIKTPYGTYQSVKQCEEATGLTRYKIMKRVNDVNQIEWELINE